MKIFDLYRELGLSRVVIVTRYGCGHEEEQDLLYMGMDEKKELLQSLRTENVSNYANFEIENDLWGTEGKITLIKEEKGKCRRCHYPELIKCSDMPKPTGFCDKEFFHGLDAYNFDDPIYNLSELLEHSEWEICTSTKALGNLGVICTGDVVTASSVDLASYVVDGERCFLTTKRAEGIVSDYSQLDSSMWAHDEIVMKNTNIKAFWVRDSYDLTLSTKLAQKAKDLGVKFYVLDADGNKTELEM